MQIRKYVFEKTMLSVHFCKARQVVSNRSDPIKEFQKMTT